ncbi:cobyrinate a,c-diamide synthase [Pseudoduganella danionis]|uniref:Cobyrinate a,c-diamide synthase n=1 Tax=Pseudoduganella danionis TaxID=1890295 RepID=A0ABW9STZ1_9BURK|nr:cobyrinate a,c-diamide synthase [Pseudoduganella danionis]MTW35485.1 cobyrinate a,c-diamide synthase [Pseudoduganella danionis]
MVTQDYVEARAVLVSAIASGQGKTSITAALARKLVQQGQRVRVFKCGPDFIDPMILERASGATVRSLDLWMVGEELCRRQLAQAAAEADVLLLEGVMGLYDGTPSSADLSRAFGVPVMAVIDAAAMAQTAGAVVHGLRDYGPVQLAGVIANRVASVGHARMVAASLRDIPLFATLPKQARALPERHLGLMLPDDVSDIDTLLDQLAEQLVFDQQAWDAMPPVRFAKPSQAQATAPLLAGRTVAVARDQAFMFIYPHNLEVLRELGATLKFFSPLANQPVPAEADAVYLPGGYPELHAQTLAQASIWQASMRAVHAAGLPIVAECGGMMALAETLTDQAGDSWPMAALLPGAVSMRARLSGLGLQALPTAQGDLRGHTFHYSQLETALAPAAHTVKHPSALQGEAWYRHGSLAASYFHAYFPSNPAATAALFSGSAA